MRALEREIVALQDLAASTGEGEHIKVLKRKQSDLLGFSVQGALVCSHFQYVGSSPHRPPHERAGVQKLCSARTIKSEH